ncbi:hypothetical protein [Chryseobacterium sp. 52]|uniref:hypothetical protein n=1 Tax=Chryseobacterium sp. 52 TaxID=2035213 RepID=UPI0015D4BD26|nr:hypothetical protein [Chryseobacterium sp. 52]
MSILFIFCMLISCKKKYETDDFRTELKPYLERLSKEKHLPVSDTTAMNFIEKNATQEELIKLMNFQKPLLRVLSYRIIVKRGEPEYFNILLDHLDDKDQVIWWYYEDAEGRFTVSDLMIRKAQEKNGLSPIQKKFLVQKVLLEHPDLETSDWMIQNINPEEKYYKLIKSRAALTDQQNNCGKRLGAAFALSKFKKKEDVEFLHNIFKNHTNDYCADWVFRGIETFPDEKFFPILETYFEQKIINKLTEAENIYPDILYFARAVAAYKNKRSTEILNYIETHNTYRNKWSAGLPSNKEYVLKATLIHYDKMYDDMISRIKKEMNPCDANKIGFGLILQEHEEDRTW